MEYCVYSKLHKVLNLVEQKKTVKLKNQQVVDAILASLQEKVSQFVEEESNITDSIEYEERILELSRKFARSLIVQTKGDFPKSRNSKKNVHQFRQTGIKKGHVLLKGTSKFGISQQIQVFFWLLGQSVVYNEGCELIEQLMGLEDFAPQLQRACLHYGETIDDLI